MAIEPIYDKKRPREIDHICLDSTKAVKHLNWRPKVGLEEGISLAKNFYKKSKQHMA